MESKEIDGTKLSNVCNGGFQLFVKYAQRISEYDCSLMLKNQTMFFNCLVTLRM